MYLQYTIYTRSLKATVTITLKESLWIKVNPQLTSTKRCI